MKIHLLSNSARKDGQNWRCGAGSRNTIGRPSPNRNTHKCLGTCSSRGHSEDSRTADFYRKHAREYFDSTARLSLEPLYQPFIRRLPQRANVLDAGCGSGRDTKAFKEKGFRVECIDASPELARMATHLTGQTCRVMSFQNITFRNKFNGVWACASLVHVPRPEIVTVLRRFSQALKPGGILYASLKKGSGDKTAADGRLFTNYTSKEFTDLLFEAGFKIVKCWRSKAVDASGQTWLNFLARKRE